MEANTTIPAQLADHEARLRAIEAQIGIERPSQTPPPLPAEKEGKHDAD